MTAYLDHLAPEALARAKAIASLNDAARRAGPTSQLADWVMTRTVADLLPVTKMKVMLNVMGYSAFTEDNDPHGEHDFGSFDIDGDKFFWKIDYYDRQKEYGSDDPADPAKTCRVITVMLASDY